MKKNKMMRIAAVLLVVTLLSTCAISGTFAKYVTKESASDSARVAKWGIVITAEGGLFSDKYDATDEKYVAAGGTVSVKADNGDAVVAPGTSSDLLDAGFTATVKGTPEVATRYSLKLTGMKDVLLPVGEYKDYTNTAEKFAVVAPANLPVAADNFKGYSPVKWDVTVSKPGTDKSISLADTAQEAAGAVGYSALADVMAPGGISITDATTIAKKVGSSNLYKTALLNMLKSKFAGLGANIRNLDVVVDGDDIILSLDFDPGYAVDYVFEGSWKWDFETDAAKGVAAFPGLIDGEAGDIRDMADTYLGNVAANVDGIDKTGVSTDLEFNFEASATQID